MRILRILCSGEEGAENVGEWGWGWVGGWVWCD